MLNGVHSFVQVFWSPIETLSRNALYSGPLSILVWRGSPVWPQTGLVGAPLRHHPTHLLVLLHLLSYRIGTATPKDLKLCSLLTSKDTFQLIATSAANSGAMEEAKLIRMATAISQYTHSSMLRETVHNAAAMINQAAQSASQLPWIPEHIVTDLVQRQRELAQLEHAVMNYQKELAAEVEEAQKDLMIMKQPQECNELDSNFDSEL